CGPGESAKGWRAKLHDRLAGGAAGHIGRTGRGLYPPMIRRPGNGRILGATLLWMIFVTTAFAQESDLSHERQMSGTEHKPTLDTTAPVTRQPAAPRYHWLADRAEDFAGDQKEIWTSPRKLRFSDTAWLVPLSGLGAGLFVTDSDIAKHLSHNPETQSRYKTISNTGLAAMAGGAGLMWAFGYKNHSSHWRETGFLAGEAALNSL